MREFRTSGSVGGRGGNAPAYPELRSLAVAAKSLGVRRDSSAPVTVGGPAKKLTSSEVSFLPG